MHNKLVRLVRNIVRNIGKFAREEHHYQTDLPPTAIQFRMALATDPRWYGASSIPRAIETRRRGVSFVGTVQTSGFHVALQRFLGSPLAAPWAQADVVSRDEDSTLVKIAVTYYSALLDPVIAFIIFVVFIRFFGRSGLVTASIVVLIQAQLSWAGRRREITSLLRSLEEALELRRMIC